MSNWKTCALEDACDIFDGPHATPEKQDSGPYFLSISSLQNGHLDLSESAFISEEDYSEWTRRVIPRHEDIVFSYETRLGQAAMVPKGLRCCLGRRMGLLRSKDRSFADPHFLLHYYLGDPFQKVIKDNTVFGTTVDRIPLQKMGGFEIALPPLPEQKKIAEILSGIGKKINARRSSILKTQLLRANLLSDLMQNAEADASEHSLGSIVEVINGRAYKLSEWEEQGTPVIRLQNLTKKGGNFYYSNLRLPEKQYCNKGDLLFMWSASFGPHLWWGEKAIYHYHIWKMLPKDETLKKEYLYLLLQHKTALWKSQGAGMAMIHLTKEGIEKEAIPLPSLGVQERVVNAMSSIDQHIEKMEEEVMKYSLLQNALSADLLSGRKRVSV